MKIIKYFGIILTILLSFGCSPKTNEEILYQAQKHITNIQSYSCTARTKIHGNKEPQTYVMKQWFKAPNKYRIEIIEPEELKGKTTIYNGEKAFLSHPRIGQEWVLDSFRNSLEKKMFLGYFINNFLNTEDTKVDKEVIKGKEYILLTSFIPGNNPHFFKEQLWFDIEDYYPYRLQIINSKDEIVVDVQYYNVKINDKIEDDVFTIMEN